MALGKGDLLDGLPHFPISNKGDFEYFGLCIFSVHIGRYFKSVANINEAISNLREMVCFRKHPLMLGMLSGRLANG
jgi:hypothetical protein